jgi:hypothetical protein
MILQAFFIGAARSLPSFHRRWQPGCGGGAGTWVSANHFAPTGNGQGVDEVEDIAVSGLCRQSRTAAGDVELPSHCRPCSQWEERRRRPPSGLWYRNSIRRLGWSWAGSVGCGLEARLSFFSIFCFFFFHFMISIQLFEFKLTLEVFDFMTSYKIQLILIWHNMLVDTLHVYCTGNTLYIV